MPTSGEARPDPPMLRRIIASPVQWFALRAEKDGPCRVCGSPPPCELHHIVARSRRGDDVAANLAPLCVGCHDLVERRNSYALRALHDSLTDSERDYCAAKLGPGALERIFGEAGARVTRLLFWLATRRLHREHGSAVTVVLHRRAHGAVRLSFRCERCDAARLA